MVRKRTLRVGKINYYNYTFSMLTNCTKVQTEKKMLFLLINCLTPSVIIFPYNFWLHAF